MVHQQNVLLFLFFALFIGAFMMYILSRTKLKLQFTVVIFAFGIISAIGYRFTRPYNTLDVSISMWAKIDPHLLLFVFLPALLFGEAMSLNPHQFRNGLPASLIIAFPGAVLVAFALAGLTMVTLPYDWPWSVFFILGAILCTTDAVAMVAVMNSSGASQRVQYLLKGETLFNDATALILYNLFYSVIRAQHVARGIDPTPLNIFLYFVKVIFISPLLGLAFGLTSVLVLSLANRRMEEEDTTIQLATTICCAYLSFFVGEEVLVVSGVIACVVAGIVLANYASPLILHHHTMHSIWSYIQWIGNTLIFVLAGLIIGTRSILSIHWRDVAYILVVYLFVLITRALLMVLLYPIFRGIHYAFSVKELVFISWGGLRGAIGMAIALSLSQSVEAGETSLTSTQSDQVFIIVGGVVVLTLIVNASLSDRMLRWLGLVQASTVAEAHIMLNYVRKRLFKKSRVLLEEVCRSFETHHKQDQQLLQQGSEVEHNVVHYSCNKQLVLSYCSIFRHYRMNISGPAANIGERSGGVDGSPQLSQEETSGRVNDNMFLGVRLRESHYELKSDQPSQIESYGDAVSSSEQQQQEQHSTPHHPAVPLAATDTPVVDLLHFNPAILGVRSLHRMDSDLITMPVVELSTVNIVPSSKSPRNRGMSGTGEKDDEWHRQHERECECEREHHPHETRAQVRRAFLEAVRVNYWKQINSGKLPRTSTATLSLLNSVDVALETHHTPGLNDWEALVDGNKRLFTQHNDDEAASVDLQEEERLAEYQRLKQLSFRSGSAKDRETTQAMKEALEEHRRERQQQQHIQQQQQQQQQQQPQRSTLQPQVRELDNPPPGKLSRSVHWTVGGEGAGRGHDEDEEVKESDSPIYDFVDIEAQHPIRRSTTDMSHPEDGRTKHRVDPLHQPALDTQQPPPSSSGSRLSQWRNSVLSGKTNPLGLSFVSQHSWANGGNDNDNDNDVCSENGLKRRNYGRQKSLLAVFKRATSEYYTAKKVYLLSSFIEAHEYAQTRIQYFLHESEHFDTLPATEASVIEESKALVRLAKEKLCEIDSNVITLQVSKQTARWILHLQEDMVAEFQSEGMLTEKDANLILEEVRLDLDRLGGVEWSSMILSTVSHKVNSIAYDCCVLPWLHCFSCCKKCFTKTMCLTGGVAGDAVVGTSEQQQQQQQQWRKSRSYSHGLDAPGAGNNASGGDEGSAVSSGVTAEIIRNSALVGGATDTVNHHDVPTQTFHERPHTVPGGEQEKRYAEGKEDEGNKEKSGFEGEDSNTITVSRLRKLSRKLATDSAIDTSGVGAEYIDLGGRIQSDSNIVTHHHDGRGGNL